MSNKASTKARAKAMAGNNPYLIKMKRECHAKFDAVAAIIDSWQTDIGGVPKAWLHDRLEPIRERQRAAWKNDVEEFKDRLRGVDARNDAYQVIRLIERAEAAITARMHGRFEKEFGVNFATARDEVGEKDG